MALDHPDQRALLERPIADHGDLPFAREREDPVFDFAVENVVGDLHEIDRLAAHDLLDLLVPATFRRRDPHVPQSPRFLHREESRQVLLPRHQVVDLQQVEARNAPEPARLLDLAGSARARGDPDLAGREELRRTADPVPAVADDFLRGAVHRRRVDQPPAVVKEGAHDFGAGLTPCGVVADVERDPAAEADERQTLRARRDGPGEDRRALGGRGPRPENRGRAGRREGREQSAAAERCDSRRSDDHPATFRTKNEGAGYRVGGAGSSR